MHYPLHCGTTDSGSWPEILKLIVMIAHNMSYAANPPPPPPPPPPVGPCGTCEDDIPGKPSAVTLIWACDGPAPASATVNSPGNYDAATGILSVNSGGDKLEKDLEISYAGGTDTLHTSCSAELGPGVVTQSSNEDKKCQDSCTCSGCWRITSMMGEAGIEFCEVCPVP